MEGDASMASTIPFEVFGKCGGAELYMPLKKLGQWIQVGRHYYSPDQRGGLSSFDEFPEETDPTHLSLSSSIVEPNKTSCTSLYFRK